MRVAIVDDSALDAKCLYECIGRYCESHKVHMQVDQYDSSTSFLSACTHTTYDLAFLDIFLSEDDNRTGIEVSARLKERYPNCFFIFTTSSTDYAVEAFRLHALDYLVKPYSYAQFEDSMDHFSKAFQQFEHYITLKEGRQQTRIMLHDILYTDYHNHYIQVHTTTSIIRSYMSFDEFLPLLEPYHNFLWCYRNCIVNLDYVSALEEKDFLLKNGERLPISRMRKNEVLQAYADYVFDYVNRGN